jgi:DNA-binding FrmR family transcriptional regulator
MKQQIDIEAIVKRLKRIEGQVRGVIRMVEDGQSCEDLLIQISSIRASVNKTGQFLMEEHLNNCIIEGIRRGRANDTIRKLTTALDQYSRLV